MISTRTLTDQTSGDPYFANVSLLLHMDGTNGSTTFTDSGPNARTMTASNASISTTGTMSGFGQVGIFNGTSAYVYTSSSIALNSNDFTIEFWCYPLDVRTFSLYDSRTNETNPNGNGFVIGTNSSQQWVIYQASNRIVGPTVTANAWSFISVQRIGTAVKMFLNGTQIGSTYTTSSSFSDGAFLIGTDYPKNARFFYGRIDDFRVTIGGTARPTTTPTGPFPNS